MRVCSGREYAVADVMLFQATWQACPILAQDQYLVSIIKKSKEEADVFDGGAEASA